MSSDSALTLLREAKVIPPLRQPAAFRGAAGVFDQSGHFCDAANTLRRSGPQLRPRSLDARPDKCLPGRHLFAGQLNHHFGHFLCESLARLWALDNAAAQAPTPLSSILLLPRRSQSAPELAFFQKEIFNLLQIGIPIRIVDAPLLVEELLVPEQGFGNARLSAGTEAFRNYMRSHFATGIAPDGPENLYISRESLNLLSGSVLAEETLSKYLSRNGYEVFAPERHDIRTQIARYKAARRVIAVEGSALHLYGFVGHADQQVAILARRANGRVAEGIANQIRAFCQNGAQVINAVSREWDQRPGPVRTSKSVSMLDMPCTRSTASDKPPPGDNRICADKPSCSTPNM
jgi:capsular polysaccharide biosynthesis protein